MQPMSPPVHVLFTIDHILKTQTSRLLLNFYIIRYIKHTIYHIIRYIRHTIDHIRYIKHAIYHIIRYIRHPYICKVTFVDRVVLCLFHE